jgi:hypothetical protein
VNTEMSCQFVRPAEALCAAWKCAGMWLLASVCSNVTSLVLKTMKGLFADGTLVWAWHVSARNFNAGSLEATLHARGNQADWFLLIHCVLVVVDGAYWAW